jgi:hypothetical protein
VPDNFTTLERLVVDFWDAVAAVTIGIADLDDTKSRMLRAFADHEQGAFITFPTVELLWKVITPKRWELLRAMAGAGPLAIREVARLIGRDIKSVHGDVSALLRPASSSVPKTAASSLPVMESMSISCCAAPESELRIPARSGWIGMMSLQGEWCKAQPAIHCSTVMRRITLRLSALSLLRFTRSFHQVSPFIGR